MHYDNVLVSAEDTVNGVLDFEFCAYDWRAMELAVGLSKYVSEENPLPLIEEFVTGYSKVWIAHMHIPDRELLFI